MTRIKTLVDSTPKAKANGTDAASKTSDGEEVVDSYKDVHDAEIAEETTTLLHGFARQQKVGKSSIYVYAFAFWLCRFDFGDHLQRSKIA